MAPKFREFPETTFVGLETKFVSSLSAEKNNHIKIPALWQQYMAAAKEIPARSTSADYGLIYCVPEVEKAHPEE